MSHSYLQRYLQSRAAGPVSVSAAAFFASLDSIGAASPSITSSIIDELNSQRQNLKLIASENFSSLAVQLAQGNLLTDKYAEGFVRRDPHAEKYESHRFYAGCDNVDSIEYEASELAKLLFGSEHAFVQPHSGADANLIAFVAVLHRHIEGTHQGLEKGKAKFAELYQNASLELWQQIRKLFHNQRLLALDFNSGGHLTHGYRLNISAQLFDCHFYRVNPVTGLIDLDAVRRVAHEVKPIILLAGYSAYPRLLNFAKFREIADEVGAILMVDMAHFAGLVAGKLFRGDFNPIPFAHIVTSTTHKTLRGPRGGIVLCQKEFADYVDKACPSVMGGPLPHVMAAKAIAFREALGPEFQDYARRIVENARAFAESCLREGIPVLTGGTDNHIVLMDVAKGFGLNGRQAEAALRSCAITLNRNALPTGTDGMDPKGPWYTSGLRAGTPAVTTLGMGREEMGRIANAFKTVLAAVRPGEKAKYVLDDSVKDKVTGRIRELLHAFPLYPELDPIVFKT